MLLPTPKEKKDNKHEASEKNREDANILNNNIFVILK